MSTVSEPLVGSSRSLSATKRHKSVRKNSRRIYSAYQDHEGWVCSLFDFLLILLFNRWRPFLFASLVMSVICDRQKSKSMFLFVMYCVIIQTWQTEVTDVSPLWGWSMSSSLSHCSRIRHQIDHRQQSSSKLHLWILKNVKSVRKYWQCGWRWAVDAQYFCHKHYVIYAT